MLLSTALPEEGRRMTMGSGRSDCYRVGVTYGYRECLRKGRVRQKLRRKFAESWHSTNLRRASIAKSSIHERTAHFLLCYFCQIPAKAFRGVSLRPYIEKIPAHGSNFLLLSVGFF